MLDNNTLEHLRLHFSLRVIIISPSLAHTKQLIESELCADNH